MREIDVCVCALQREREAETKGGDSIIGCLVELPSLATMRLEESLSHFLLGHPVLFNYDDE